MAKYFDLTQSLWKYSPKTPNTRAIEVTELRGAIESGVVVSEVRVNLHSGTHIDAPYHFGYKMTLDEVPLDVLCGPGVVLDMKRDAWGVITAEDLEQASPKIEEGDRVILNTGWHKYFDDHQKFMLRYPGLDKSAVDWFVNKKVSWVGSDTPSPDHAFCLTVLVAGLRPDVYTKEVIAGIDRKKFPITYCHRTLLGHNILMVEQLGGEIDAITGKRVNLFALPPKYKWVEGSQIRVIAMT